MVKQWWLVFVLLGVDSTLEDEREIWEYLHSLRGVSQRLSFLVCVWFKQENQEVG